MKIYILHSTSFDFKKDLYLPIRRSPLNTEHQITLPHETDNFIDSKEIIKNSDIIVAEVSYPSTGMGIELGWANDAQILILFLYKEGSKISRSLKNLSGIFIEYKNSQDLIEKLSSTLLSIQK